VERRNLFKVIAIIYIYKNGSRTKKKVGFAKSAKPTLNYKIKPFT